MQVGKYCLISDNAEIDESVTIGDFVTINDGVRIGPDSRIESHCIIGYSNGRERSGLNIGRDSHIRSHSTIYLGNEIGEGLITGHSAVLRENSVIGDGFQLGTKSVVMGEVEIGNYVRTGSNVEIGQGSKIGNFVWIFINSSLINDKHPPSEVVTGVEIRDFAILGAHAIVFPGIVVGEDSLVGSGCLLTIDLPPHQIAVGNPVKILGSTDKIKMDDGVTPAYPWRKRFHRGYPEEIVRQWLSELDRQSGH